MLERFTQDQLIFMSSTALGVGVAWLLISLLRIVYRNRRQSAREWEFEETQRVDLRRESSVIRWFEPLVEELLPAVPKMSESEREDYSRKLQAAGESIAWKPPELFVAATYFEGIGIGLGAALFGYLMSDESVALLMFIAGVFGYPSLIQKQTQDRAFRRLSAIKSRLPYAIDLMAFMMQAGAGFYEALNTVVAENRGHVLGDELSHVLNEISMGRSRQTALEHLSQRLRDGDIDELVFAINKGEEMGTPLSEILRLQADQMRLKRSQWMEAAAGNAQVMIVFPGMLIMISCLIIVMAPFILPAIE